MHSPFPPDTAAAREKPAHGKSNGTNQDLWDNKTRTGRIKLPNESEWDEGGRNGEEKRKIMKCLGAAKQQKKEGRQQKNER